MTGLAALFNQIKLWNRTFIAAKVCVRGICPNVAKRLKIQYGDQQNTKATKQVKKVFMNYFEIPIDVHSWAYSWSLTLPRRKQDVTKQLYLELWRKSSWRF